MKAVWVVLCQAGSKFHSGLNWLFPAPASWRSTSRITEAIGLLGLFFLFLGLGPAKSLQNTGMTLMLFSLILSWKTVLPALRRDPFALLTLLWIFYLVFNAALATWSPYGGGINHFEDVRSLGRIYLVILVAWWLGGSVKGLYSVLLLALTGLLIAVLQEVARHGWEFSILIRGPRLDFVRNAQDFGLFAAAALLGLLLLAKRIIGPFSQNKILLIVRLTLWIGITLLVSVSFAAAEVRSQWLALGVVSMMSTLILLGRAILTTPFQPIRLFAPLAVIVAAGLLLFSQWDRATERWQREAHIYPLILKGDLKKIPTTSVGHRIHLWGGALDAIKERPLLGWGPSSAEAVIKKAKIPKKTKKQFGHFHNSYLDMAVRTGLIGVAFMIGFFFLILRALWRGHQRGHIAGDIALFYMGTLLVLVIGNATESFVRFQFGWFFMAAVMALIYRHTIMQGQKTA